MFGTFGKSGLEITGLFGIEHAEGYSSDEFKLLWNLLLFDLHGKLHLKSMHYHVICRHTSILMHLEGVHKFNLLTLSQAFLSIESTDKISTPNFDCDTVSLYHIFEKEHLIPGRTILLVPYAKSVKLIPMSFWIKLANQLTTCGFCVCTNSIGEHEPPIECTTAIRIPYSKSVPFLELAGATVGLRSGFQDVTCTARCPKFTLYPKNNYKRSIACDINESYSMINMYHQAEQYDIIYSQEDEDMIVHRIVEKLLNSLCRSNAEKERAY